MRHRRSTRLPSYLYSGPGAYFVTVCSHRRAMSFGRVENEAVELSGLGRIVLEMWRRIPVHFPFAEPVALVIMPNHIHGVILLQPQGQVSSDVPRAKGFQPQGVQLVVRNFKAEATVAARQAGHLGPVWQRGYYDRILRNEDEVRRACEYIALNPMRWALDLENPDRKRH